MTLLEYIKEHPGEEIAVHDVDYEMEAYFYGKEPDDDWDKAMQKLASVLTIVHVEEHGSFVYTKGVTVNLSELVEAKLEQLRQEDLFIIPTTDAIMSDMHNILAGYTSEEWLTDFANILGGKE